MRFITVTRLFPQEQFVYLNIAHIISFGASEKGTWIATVDGFQQDYKETLEVLRDKIFGDNQ